MLTLYQPNLKKLICINYKLKNYDGLSNLDKIKIIEFFQRNFFEDLHKFMALSPTINEAVTLLNF